MKAIKTIAIGAVGTVALVGAAAPASAQYPGYGYGHNTNPVNVIGQVLQSVINPYQGNRYAYGMNPQMAAQRCTAAVQQRLQYSNRGYGYGYNNAYSQARVLNVTRVEPRSRTTTRIRGLATSGMNYGNYGQYGYGAYGAVGYGYAAPADLEFKCDVDYRGYVRDIDIDRR